MAALENNYAGLETAAEEEMGLRPGKIRQQGERYKRLESRSAPSQP